VFVAGIGIDFQPVSTGKEILGRQTNVLKQGVLAVSSRVPVSSSTSTSDTIYSLRIVHHSPLPSSTKHTPTSVHILVLVPLHSLV
jgi:hypothetical protein